MGLTWDIFHFSKIVQNKTVLSQDNNSSSLYINKIEAKIWTVFIIWFVGVGGIKQFPGSDWLEERASWFSHDVTKIQTEKLAILPRLYFHDALEQLKNFQTNWFLVLW